MNAQLNPEVEFQKSRQARTGEGVEHEMARLRKCPAVSRLGGVHLPENPSTRRRR